MDASPAITLIPHLSDPVPPPTNPLPTLISRYDILHGARREPLRASLEDDAKSLTAAVTSWKHSTNFFASYRGIQLLMDYRKRWEKLLMPGKRQTAPINSRPEWKGFLEATLNDDQIADADKWTPKPAEIWELVHGLLEGGYDLSLSYQARERTVTVTLKDTKPDRATAGYAISTRDTNAPTALKLALWKHYNVLIRDWTPLLSTPVKPRRG